MKKTYISKSVSNCFSYGHKETSVEIVNYKEHYFSFIGILCKKNILKGFLFLHLKYKQDNNGYILREEFTDTYKSVKWLDKITNLGEFLVWMFWKSS